MPQILPFPALRYDPHRLPDVAQVLCPPYDVINPAEKQAYQAQSSYNAVYIELPDDRPGEPGSRYANAAEILTSWRAQGVLQQDAPSYYLHATRFSFEGRSHTRCDLIAALGVEPWATGAVLPHEATHAGPKADRLALLRAAHANLSPIWVLHRQPIVSLAAAWEAAQKTAPVLDVTFEGEEHRLWRVDDPAQVGAIHRELASSGPLYIADGHHRYETALNFAQEAGDQIPAAKATLAVVTWADDPGLLVLPTHRLLHGQPRSLAEVEQTGKGVLASEHVSLSSSADEAAGTLLAQVLGRGANQAAFGVAAAGSPETGALLTLESPDAAVSKLPADRSDAWRKLDVSLLHAVLLERFIAETGLPREEALSYTRDAAEAMAAVRSGDAAAAFLLNATRVQQVLDVADAHDRMPEKSTFFHPKPPTGLVLRVVE